VEFAKFANAAKSLVVLSADDPGCQAVSQMLTHPNVIRFGESTSANVRLTEIDASKARISFKVHFHGAAKTLELTIPGHHNALNAAAAIAALVGCGFDFEQVADAVATFGGTERRFELHGEVRGVKVYDDFAHHPTEVIAALKAARAVVGGGKLITVFQPHLFSRTRLFAQEFADALLLSDEAVVTDIYPAREDPEPGVTGELIAERSKRSQNMHYVPAWDDVPAAAAALAKEGDFIITMGCGDINRMVPELLSALEK
jgi:UDP-N-acetylmuramate--alanine ligase